MKVTLSLVVFGLAAVLSNPVDDGKKYKTVDQAFLKKQYKVLTLFKHIQQPSYLEEHVEIYRNVKDPIQYLQRHKKSCKEPKVVDTLIQFMNYDYMLQKGEIFSIMYEEHLDQAINLFKLFYYAKDFDTFYETAVVMRKYMNEGLFLYSVSVALAHRKDCYGLILPPIYEVYPWYFLPSDVIQQAYKYKMIHANEQKEQTHRIIANYTGMNLNLHPEQSLTYYLEDVGVNAFYYYYHIHYPFWMDGEEFHIANDLRGELLLGIYQALIARYYMERMSQGLGEVPYFDWEAPFEVPYQPFMMYPNGVPFPERSHYLDFQHYAYGQHVYPKFLHRYNHIKDYERRVRDIVDSGAVWDMKERKFVGIYNHEDSVNTFGNVVEGNPDSPIYKYINKYSMYATYLLGSSYTPKTWKEVVPSVMEHPETRLRDPATYMLLKKKIQPYHQYQNHLKPYEKEELLFPGVSISKVEMDKLITYFDEFNVDLSNAVYDSVEELKDDKFQIMAVQQRLNHKPFTYKIHVNSNQDTQAMVKVFIGLKYDEYGRYINISENRLNFYPIDAFKWHLKTGQNVIKRSSLESFYYAYDKTSYQKLFEKVTRALNGQGEFHITGEENQYHFPDRFMLPMGSYGGVPYQFYFIVYPYQPYEGQKEEMTYFYPHPGTGGGYVDEKPMFYPLDRPIKFEKMFVTDVPNSYFYETKVYHRNADEAKVQQLEF